MKTLSTILATAMTVATIFTSTALYLVSTDRMEINLAGLGSEYEISQIMEGK